MKVPERVWAKWKSRAGQRQVIGQAELLPVVVAKMTFPDLLRNRRVLVFIDNEAARIGLVRCYSPSLPSLRLIAHAVSLDLVLGCQCWYARVPTKANPADLPSRLTFSPFLESLGCECVEPVLPNWW